MPRVEKEVTILNKQGLHARPAALFVQLAAQFDSNITLIKDSEKVNGKSIMGILMLAAECKSKILLEADGEDAQEAVKELENFLLKEE
ncbi:MAG: HPr family phosphocarrier protein [Candidatus Omnitrophota bacterium]